MEQVHRYINVDDPADLIEVKHLYHRPITEEVADATLVTDSSPTYQRADNLSHMAPEKLADGTVGLRDLRTNAFYTPDEAS